MDRLRQILDPDIRAPCQIRRRARHFQNAVKNLFGSGKPCALCAQIWFRTDLVSHRFYADFLRRFYTEWYSRKSVDDSFQTYFILEAFYIEVYE